MDNREANLNPHPPACTCVECTQRRLEGTLGKKASHRFRGSVTTETSSGNKADRRAHGGNWRPGGYGRPGGGRGGGVPDWLKALLLVFALLVLGLATIPLVSGHLYVFWMLLGFGTIFALERWLSRYTLRPKLLGKLYRLGLNLTILSALGFVIWSAVELFSHRFLSTPVTGTVVFLGTSVFFIWLWRVVARNSWRKPSMKLTVFSLVVLCLVLAFAGVQPLASYKDQVTRNVVAYAAKDASSASSAAASAGRSAVSQFSQSAQATLAPALIRSGSVATLPSSETINPRTGTYKNFYLGLVDTPEGDIVGNGCYDDTGDFIVLINNKDAVNPTYSQLVNFLQQDKTDEFPYTYKLTSLGTYYGTAESHVDLKHIQDIIDGTAQPANPDVCADFAERLHNDAEMAGIRCGYVSIDLSGYPDPDHLGIPSDTSHALDVFYTTDQGLVYVDDTNSPGPARSVKTVNLQEGQPYVPESLFPEPGWSSTWDSMGTVTSIFTTWDGSWNN